MWVCVMPADNAPKPADASRVRRENEKERRWWISGVALGAAATAGGIFPPSLSKFPYKKTRPFGILKELFLEGIHFIFTKQVYLKGSTGMLFCALRIPPLQWPRHPLAQMQRMLVAESSLGSLSPWINLWWRQEPHQVHVSSLGRAHIYLLVGIRYKGRTL